LLVKLKANESCLLLMGSSTPVAAHQYLPCLMVNCGRSEVGWVWWGVGGERLTAMIRPVDCYGHHVCHLSGALNLLYQYRSFYGAGVSMVHCWYCIVWGLKGLSLSRWFASTVAFAHLAMAEGVLMQVCWGWNCQ